MLTATCGHLLGTCREFRVTGTVGQGVVTQIMNTGGNVKTVWQIKEGYCTP